MRWRNTANRLLEEVTPGTPKYWRYLYFIVNTPYLFSSSIQLFDDNFTRHCFGDVPAYFQKKNAYLCCVVGYGCSPIHSLQQVALLEASAISDGNKKLLSNKMSSKAAIKMPK